MNRMMNQHFMKCVTCDNFPCPFVAEMFPCLIKDVEHQKVDDRKEFVDHLIAKRDSLWAAAPGPDDNPVIAMVISDFVEVGFYATYDIKEDFPDKDFLGTALVFNESLIVSYDLCDVFDLGGVGYLLGPLMITGMDEDGNDCCISDQEIIDALDFVETALTEITVDGKSYQALRLV